MDDLRSVDGQSIWQDLGPDRQREIKGAMETRRVSRGETLIQRGSASQTLFIVSFGLFLVYDAEGSNVVGEIGAGQLIGEMKLFFFCGRAANRLGHSGPRFRSTRN
jgi:CRP-like cAMP-binding protein